jgi:hypothetical protein
MNHEFVLTTVSAAGRLTARHDAARACEGHTWGAKELRDIKRGLLESILNCRHVEQGRSLISKNRFYESFLDGEVDTSAH